jgi:catechol 2,3-dioxygenase-like lactoylglutathione lyase family enzyme
MNKLPLLRVSEVAFLAPKLEECVGFYRKIGLQDLTLNPQRINFANIGEQLFGLADEKRGFLDGYGSYRKAPFHVAFEVPSGKLDECVAFLNAKGIKTSPKNEFSDWHGTTKSTSIYFTDPAGNIMELWAPETKMDQAE